jgi:ferrous iron transport protein B
MWDRSKVFLRKMGKVILVGSIIVWFLSSFPQNPVLSRDYAAEKQQVKSAAETNMAKAGEIERRMIEDETKEALADLHRQEKSEQTQTSYIGRIGRFIAPAFAPLGIDWRAGVALLSGFVAKEIVVSTLGVLHAAGNAEEEGVLEQALIETGMTPLSALSMMVFVLLYLPCLATTAAIRRETGSYKWMFFSIGYSTSVAWGMAFLIYQGGFLLGFN